MPLSPQQEHEIEALRAARTPTRRAVVPALEEILYEALPVLDQGFVRVIDYMGDIASESPQSNSLSMLRVHPVPTPFSIPPANKKRTILGISNK
jgi:hypothetical protein